jgi:small subunit ribosomal protein S1
MPPERRAAADADWAAARERFPRGTVVMGQVLSHHPFGFFIDLADPVTGLVEIGWLKDPGQFADPADYPPTGQQVTAIVIDVVDRRGQVRLSMRPSDLS